MVFRGTKRWCHKKVCFKGKTRALWLFGAFNSSKSLSKMQKDFFSIKRTVEMTQVKANYSHVSNNRPDGIKVTMFKSELIAKSPDCNNRLLNFQ